MKFGRIRDVGPLWADYGYGQSVTLYYLGWFTIVVVRSNGFVYRSFYRGIVR